MYNQFCEQFFFQSTANLRKHKIEHSIQRANFARLLLKAFFFPDPPYSLNSRLMSRKMDGTTKNYKNFDVE